MINIILIIFFELIEKKKKKPLKVSYIPTFLKVSTFYPFFSPNSATLPLISP